MTKTNRRKSKKQRDTERQKTKMNRRTNKKANTQKRTNINGRINNRACKKPNTKSYDNDVSNKSLPKLFSPTVFIKGSEVRKAARQSSKKSESISQVIVVKYCRIFIDHNYPGFGLMCWGE